MDVPDEEGQELPDLDAARQVARKSILDVMAGTLCGKAELNLSHRIDIEDEQGALLSTVYFRDVVSVVA